MIYPFMPSFPQIFRGFLQPREGAPVPCRIPGLRRVPKLSESTVMSPSATCVRADAPMRSKSCKEEATVWTLFFGKQPTTTIQEKTKHNNNLGHNNHQQQFRKTTNQQQRQHQQVSDDCVNEPVITFNSSSTHLFLDRRIYINNIYIFIIYIYIFIIYIYSLYIYIYSLYIYIFYIHFHCMTCCFFNFR